MDNPVIILGAGRLGKAALDIFMSNDNTIYCFLDDDTSLHNTEIKEITVLGSTDDENYLNLIGKNCEVFIAEDDNKVKRSFVKILNEKRKVMPVNAIHKLAYISPNATLGHGNFINAGVNVGAFAGLGNHGILHSGSIVEHETTLGDYVQVGAGSVIGSGVTVANDVFIGSGVTIVSGISIGKGSRIGAGSVVIKDIVPNQTVFGNPAHPVE